MLNYRSETSTDLRATMSGSGRRLCFVSAIFLTFVAPIFADPRFESARTICGAQRGVPAPQERIAACNIVISAGPHGGGDQKFIANSDDPSTKGAVFYSFAFAGRAVAYMTLAQHENAIRDLTEYIDFVNASDPRAWNVRFSICIAGYRPRAIAHLATGAYEEAISDLNACEAHTSIVGGRRMSTDSSLEFNSLKVVNLGLRGDIAMAMKQYELAAQYYEVYRNYNHQAPGMAEKIALAKRLAANPSSPITPLPGPTLPPNEACRLFPNLC